MTAVSLQDALDRAGDAASAQISPSDVAATLDELLSAIEETRELVNKDLASAIERARMLCEISDAHHLSKAQAHARAVLAHGYNYANRFVEARTEASKSARIAQAIGDPLAEGRARMAIVHACAREGTFAEGLTEATKATRLFKDAGDPGWAARAQTNAGVLHRMSGNPTGAAELFRDALTFEGHDPTAQAQIRNNLAEALLDTGQFEQAETEFRRACKLLTEAEAWRLAAMGRGNLADLLGRQGRLAESLAEFETARRFFERDAALAELGRILIEQADVLRALGETEQAESAYRKAATLVSDAGLRAEHTRALLGLGLLLASDRPDEAARVLADADAISVELRNTATQSQIKLAQANALIAAGEPAAAIAIARSISNAHKPGHVEWLRAHIIASRAYVADGKPTDAIEHIESAFAKADELPIVRIELLHARALARREAGDRRGALADLRACCTTIERTRSSFAFARHRAALTHSRRDTYDDLIGTLLERRDEAEMREAFEMSEQARCRGWLEQLESGTAIAYESTDSDDVQLLSNLQRHRHSLNALYSQFDPASGASSALRDRIKTEEDAIEALESRLHSSRVGNAFSLNADGCESIANALEDHEGLVAFWHVGDQLIAFILRRHGIQTVECPCSPEHLSELVSGALFQIRRGLNRPGAAPSDRKRAGADRALRSLGEAIWDPIESSNALNDCPRLTIVPTGPLYAVPFPAVIGRHGSLVSHYDIAMLPSSELLPVLRGRQAPGDRALLVGVPDRAAPAIIEEIESLAQAVPGAKHLLSDDATWDAVRSESSEVAVLHLACHGTHHPDAPLASALKLADRWVTARDIMRLDLPGSVVVLSGCDTGRMDAAFGDEVQGLTRAFVAAGASALITTLWPAHDRATQGLMESLYTTAQKAGLGAASLRSALAQTQRTELHAGVHPALWAHLTFAGG
ncbi:MAG: CHAT domain-containing tetratricopeptide repeat protein [Phycisphaerales bacterium]